VLGLGILAGLGAVGLAALAWRLHEPPVAQRRELILGRAAAKGYVGECLDGPTLGGLTDVACPRRAD
jgi:hypothetical protein